MDANEIEMLAEAIVRKQNEAAEKKAAEAAAKAEADAKAAAKVAAAEAKKAEADRIAAEEAAAREAEKQARIESVLSATAGDVFIDPDGAVHRVTGVVHGGIDTVSRDRDGGTIGNWRKGRDGVDVLAAWKKKV